MLWKMDGMRLEDILPVPKKQPGRHFSAGYHMLGKTASSYDVKYAQMTYGDHYRKKIEGEIERERSRLDEVMMEPKRQATQRKKSMKTGQKTVKRYDLNELRHHQRRCAALLFGARQQGSHEVPYLVRWAPRRRESYYLMSEKVYNDRLLMKLREQEEEERRRMLESPMNFDFDDNLGNTRQLYDFQNLISKTSRHIKGLNFDTEYKDYEFDFNQVEKKRLENQVGSTSVSESPSKDGENNKRASKQSRVQFSDVTDYESDGHGDRLRREHRRARHAARELQGGLGISDIELDFYSPDFEGGSEDGSSLDGMDDEDHRLSQLLSKMSLEEASRMSRRGRNSKGSRRNRKNGSHSSNFEDSEEYSYGGSSLANKLFLNDGEDEELDDGVSELGGAHNNKYCKHSPTSSMKKRAQDYYRKLPRLLKTSELREKASKLNKEKSRFQPTGPFVNHECMASHKTAYERALALVRGRSLPEHYTDLWNRTSRITFSYIPGMPGSDQAVFKDKKGGERRLNLPTGPSGLKGVLGEVDMNDFYREEDELIYYIKPDELRTVVEASSKNADSSDDSDDDDDDDTTQSATLTRATSESYTFKLKSSLGSETESSNF